MLLINVSLALYIIRIAYSLNSIIKVNFSSAFLLKKEEKICDES